MKIKRFNEAFKYPDDIPSELNKERLYASGSNSTPGERLRNYMFPFFTYFTELEKNPDANLKDLAKGCYELLPYIKYWLRKI